MIKLNWIEEKQWPPRVCPATTNSVKIKHRLDWIGNWIRVELYCSFMHYTKYNSEPRKQHYLVYWSSASNGIIRLPSTWRIEVQLSIAATQFQYASAVVHHLMYWSVASIGSNTTTACLSKIKHRMQSIKWPSALEHHIYHQNQASKANNKI